MDASRVELSRACKGVETTLESGAHQIAMRAPPCLAIALLTACARIDDNGTPTPVAPPVAAVATPDALPPTAPSADPSADAAPPPPPPPSAPPCFDAPKIAATIHVSHEVWSPAAGYVYVLHVAVDDHRVMFFDVGSASGRAPYQLFADLLDLDTGAIEWSGRVDDPSDGGVSEISNTTAFGHGNVLVVYRSAATASHDARSDGRVFHAGSWSDPMSRVGSIDQPDVFVPVGDEIIVSSSHSPAAMGWAATSGWATVAPIPASPPLLLPDGQLAETWKPPTSTTTSFHVRRGMGAWGPEIRTDAAGSFPHIVGDRLLFLWDEPPSGSPDLHVVRAQSWSTDGKGSAVETLTGAGKIPYVYRYGRYQSFIALPDGTAEWLGLVGECAGSMASCAMTPIARRFAADAWSAPTPLDLPTPTIGGALSLMETSSGPLLFRRDGVWLAPRVGSTLLPLVSLADTNQPVIVVPGRLGPWILKSGFIGHLDVFTKTLEWKALPHEVTLPIYGEGNPVDAGFDGFAYEDPAGGLVLQWGVGIATPFIYLARWKGVGELEVVLALDPGVDKNGAVDADRLTVGPTGVVMYSVADWRSGGARRDRIHVWNAGGSWDIPDVTGTVIEHRCGGAVVAATDVKPAGGTQTFGGFDVVLLH